MTQNNFTMDTSKQQGMTLSFGNLNLVLSISKDGVLAFGEGVTPEDAAEAIALAFNKKFAVREMTVDEVAEVAYNECFGIKDSLCYMISKQTLRQIGKKAAEALAKLGTIRVVETLP